MSKRRRRAVVIALVLDVLVLVFATILAVGWWTGTRHLTYGFGSDTRQTDTYYVVYHLDPLALVAVAVGTVALGVPLVRRLRTSNEADR